MSKFDPAAPVRAQLITRRILLGMSQLQLGERLGVTQGAVAQMERSFRPHIKVATLQRWAEALDTRIEISVRTPHSVEALAKQLWDHARQGEGDPWAEASDDVHRIYTALARVALDA